MNDLNLRLEYKPQPCWLPCLLCLAFPCQPVSPCLANGALSQSNTIQSNPIQSDPIQSSPVQSNPIQSNPIQSNPFTRSIHPNPPGVHPIQSNPPTRALLPLVHTVPCLGPPLRLRAYPAPPSILFSASRGTPPGPPHHVSIAESFAPLALPFVHQPLLHVRRACPARIHALREHHCFVRMR